MFQMVNFGMAGAEASDFAASLFKSSCPQFCEKK